MSSPAAPAHVAVSQGGDFSAVNIEALGNPGDEIMQNNFKDVTAVMAYIQSHVSQYGFAPERLTLGKDAWRTAKQILDGLGHFVDAPQGIMPYKLLGVPIFQSEESKREDARSPISHEQAARIQSDSDSVFSRLQQMWRDAPAREQANARAQANATSKPIDFAFTTPPMWDATPELRYLAKRLVHKDEITLQQKWRNNLSGATEWRDVPTVAP